MANAEQQFNPSYVGVRSDVADLVRHEAKNILDVGCSTGTLGAYLKDRNKARLTGIELSPEMAEVARVRLDQVLVGDAADVIIGEGLGDQKFDTIIFADVLEHLMDPWGVLRRASQYLAPGGEIVTSLPNIRHIDTIYNLVIRGRWPMRDRGIHDRTHLRYFTRRDVSDLFSQAGLTIQEVKTHYRLIERPHPLNEYARYFAWPGLREFLAFQYLIRARVAG